MLCRHNDARAPHDWTARQIFFMDHGAASKSDQITLVKSLSRSCRASDADGARISAPFSIARHSKVMLRTGTSYYNPSAQPELNLIIAISKSMTQVCGPKIRFPQAKKVRRPNLGQTAAFGYTIMRVKKDLIYTFPASHEATLAEVGGKGLSLIEGSRVGFPVPPGFILSRSGLTGKMRSSKTLRGSEGTAQLLFNVASAFR
jgi:hypothetical protein